MNLNRDYLITVDVKKATVNTPSAMQFYITDVKTANIFAQLVINESSSELIKRYAPVENAQDFKITLRLIKPNNEPKELEFTLLNQLDAFFMVDLADEYKDQVGTYNCELFVDCMVGDELERITTSAFSYEVLPSIMNSLDEVIGGGQGYPLAETFAKKEYVDEAINEVVTIIGNDLSESISWYAIPNGSGYYKLTGVLNGSINFNGEIVHIARQATSFAKQATLHSVGKPIGNACNTAVFKDWDEAAGKYNAVEISKHATEDYVNNAIANIETQKPNYDIDLSPYATIKYVDESIANIPDEECNIPVIGGKEEFHIFSANDVPDNSSGAYLFRNVEIPLATGGAYTYENDCLMSINTWTGDDNIKYIEMADTWGSHTYFHADENGEFVIDSEDYPVSHPELEYYAPIWYVDNAIANVSGGECNIEVIGGKEEVHIFTPDDVPDEESYRMYLMKNVELQWVNADGNEDSYLFDGEMVEIDVWYDEDNVKYIDIVHAAWGSEWCFYVGENNELVLDYRDNFAWYSQLEDYATTWYVDDKIGDIEAALSAILGGEDNE